MNMDQWLAVLAAYALGWATCTVARAWLDSKVRNKPFTKAKGKR